MKIIFVLLCLSFLALSCKKDNPAPGSTTTSSGAKFMTVPNSISFQIDGKNYSLKEGMLGYYGSCSVGSSASTPIDLGWNMQSSSLDDEQMVFFSFSSPVTMDDFWNNPKMAYSETFTTGNHCYNYNFNTCDESKVNITFYNFTTNPIYTIFSNPGPDAYFNITSSATQTTSDGIIEQHVKGNFEFDNYNATSGDSIKVRNGAFYLVFRWT